MNTMRRSLFIVLSFVVFVVSCLSSIAQQPSALDSLRQSFEKQEDTVLQTYGTDLTSKMTDLKKKGDLDAYLVVESEKKRFDEEKSVPLPSEAKSSFRPASETYHKAKADLLRKYISALEGLVKKSMQTDKIEEAKLVKAEKEKMAFILADAETKGKAGEAKVEADDPVAEKTSAAKQPGVVGVWKLVARGINYGDLHEFYPDGRVRVRAAETWSGKYIFLGGSKTKVRWTCNGGQVVGMKYVAEKDVIEWDDGAYFARVAPEEYRRVIPENDVKLLESPAPNATKLTKEAGKDGASVKTSKPRTKEMNLVTSQMDRGKWKSSRLAVVEDTMVNVKVKPGISMMKKGNDYTHAALRVRIGDTGNENLFDTAGRHNWQDAQGNWQSEAELTYAADVAGEICVAHFQDLNVKVTVTVEP